MSQKKEGTESSEKKPGVKIQDLTPSKDAKGGGRFNPAGGGAAASGGGASAAGGGASAAGGGASAAGGPKTLD